MAVQMTSLPEPTVLDSAWRFRWMVLLLALGFAGLGWLFADNNEQWTAEATLAVRDPLATNLFGELVPEDSERYVQSQSAIISSRIVARRAAEILAAQEPPLTVTIDEIEANLSVTPSDTGDLITISYTATGENAEYEAIAVTNAVAEAYQEVGRSAAAAAYTSSLVGLDETISLLEDEIAATLAERADAINSDPLRQEAEQQYEDAQTDLLLIQVPGANADPEDVDLFVARLNALNLQIITLQSVLAQEDTDSTVVLLQTQVDDARDRLGNLQTRRDQLSVDAEIAGSGVVFYSPAEIAEQSGVVFYVAVGFLFGLVVGVALAWLLGRGRRRFGERHAPQEVLQARFLADIPDFGEERLRSLLPVIDAPASASAEAFRFVAGAIRLQQRASADEKGDLGFKSVAVLSSGVFDGKSVVVANTAFAAARGGARVLVVDADLGNQALTEILTGEESGSPIPGLSNVGDSKNTATVSDVLVDVARTQNETVMLLPIGSKIADPSDFFSSPDTQRLLEEASAEFDLVFMDIPPLLRVAYSNNLAGLADRGLVVVRHGSDIRSADELRHQLDLVGAPLLGYVYNAAPLRTEMTVRMGSANVNFDAQPIPPSAP
jgi:Mrp family chromosome partitioning ATPase